MKVTELDIVLPCYRPPEGWVERIIEASHFLTDRPQPITHRMIVVNDGTPEGISAQDIARLESALPHFTFVDLQVNQGKGAALRAGVSQSTSPLCLFTDIDFPYTFQSLERLLIPLQAKTVDVAVGIKNQDYYAHLPQGRVRISRFLRWLARTFLRISITDTQCGLKGFNEAGKQVFLETTIARYLADLEFIFLVDRSPKLTMKPFEVSLREGVEFSRVNLRILLTEGINFMRVFFKAFFRS